MKRYRIHVAAICATICLIGMTHAEARSLRADTNPSNGWSDCDTSTCPSLPNGLLLNPFGSDPTVSLSPTDSAGGSSVFIPDAQGGPDAQTPCISGNCSASGWSASVPGLALSWASGGATIAQVLYFNLSNQPLQTIYAPNLDASGNPTTLGTATGTAWEIEFNYDPSSVPSTASLLFNGILYSATRSVLSPSNLNEFVYYNKVLYAPTGWTASPVPLPPSLLLLSGGLAFLGFFTRRRSSPGSSKRGIASVALSGGANIARISQTAFFCAGK